MGLVSYYACAQNCSYSSYKLDQTNKMSRLREELQEFVLENVDEERVLGTGSYGSVQEVRLEQLDTE